MQANIIRPCGLQQLEQLSSWACQYYAEDALAFDAARFVAAMSGAIAQNRGGAWWIVQADDIVGYAIVLDTWTIEFGGLAVQLDELYIKPASRGLGLASLAIIALRELSKARGAVQLSMETTPDNHAAQRLYQRLGFKPSGRPVFRAEF